MSCSSAEHHSTNREATDSHARVINRDHGARSKILTCGLQYTGNHARQLLGVDIRYSQVDQRRSHRSGRRKQRRKILIVTQNERAASLGFDENVDIRGTRIQYISHSHHIEARVAQLLDDLPRHVLVSEDLHAADGISIVLPEASHDAYRRASRTSSISSSGNSSMISSGVRPAARCFRISDTGIRSPRTQGWPPHTVGSTLIRAKRASMLGRVPRRGDSRKSGGGLLRLGALTIRKATTRHERGIQACWVSRELRQARGRTCRARLSRYSSDKLVEPQIAIAAVVKLVLQRGIDLSREDQELTVGPEARILPDRCLCHGIELGSQQQMLLILSPTSAAHAPPARGERAEHSYPPLTQARTCAATDLVALFTRIGVAGYVPPATRSGLGEYVLRSTWFP